MPMTPETPDLARDLLAAGLCALLANLFVWSAAYWLSGALRRHRQILIAWGIQTFSDPKEEREDFSAKSNARDYTKHAKTAK